MGDRCKIELNDFPRYYSGKTGYKFYRDVFEGKSEQKESNDTGEGKQVGVWDAVEWWTFFYYRMEQIENAMANLLGDGVKYVVMPPYLLPAA